MGKRIVKQPDGKYAIWSTNVDHFIATDCDKDEVFGVFMDEARDRTELEVLRGIAASEDKPFSYFLDVVKEMHGEDISADFGPQKQPHSLNQVVAQGKAAAKEIKELEDE